MPQVKPIPMPGTLITQDPGDRIGETAEKMLKAGARYGLNDVVGGFHKGEYKCNKFVYDALKRSGIDAPVYPGGEWPYQAGVWGNPKFKIPGWTIVDLADAKRGDVVAQRRGYRDATGHVGIVVGSGQTLSAHNEGLGIDGYGFESDPKWTEPVVVSRYVGGRSAP